MSGTEKLITAEQEEELIRIAAAAHLAIIDALKTWYDENSKKSDGVPGVGRTTGFDNPSRACRYHLIREALALFEFSGVVFPEDPKGDATFVETSEVELVPDSGAGAGAGASDSAEADDSDSKKEALNIAIKQLVTAVALAQYIVTKLRSEYHLKAYNESTWGQYFSGSFLTGVVGETSHGAGSLANDTTGLVAKVNEAYRGLDQNKCVVFYHAVKWVTQVQIDPTRIVASHNKRQANQFNRDIRELTTKCDILTIHQKRLAFEFQGHVNTAGKKARVVVPEGLGGLGRA